MGILSAKSQGEGCEKVVTAEKKASVCPYKQQELEEQHSKERDVSTTEFALKMSLGIVETEITADMVCELFQIKRQYCPVKDNKHVLL